MSSVLGSYYPPSHVDSRTEAEAHFDDLIASRRQAGRKTYGQGLNHRDAYNWNVMALEEALDMCQYLAAENLRLREGFRKLANHAPPCAWVVREEKCDCGYAKVLNGD